VFGVSAETTKVSINSWTDAPNHIKIELFKALSKDGKLIKF